MVVKSKKYARNQDYDGNKIVNSSLNIEPICFIFSDIDTEAGQIYTLDLKARFDYNVQKIALQTDTGSLTATLKINGTAITGLSGIEATATTADYTATALNILEPGDVLTLTIDTLTDSPLQLTGNIEIKRT